MMEESLVCEEAVVEVKTESEEISCSDESGNNYSTRRLGTHEDVPPASPARSEDSSTEDEQMGTPERETLDDDAMTGEEESQNETCHYEHEAPSTPVKPPSPVGPPPQSESPVDIHLYDHAPSGIMRSTGYGVDTSTPVRARVSPMVRHETPRSQQYLGDAATTHVPATDPRRFLRLGILAEQDLQYVGARPEDVNLSAPDINGLEQAYPYARRYARLVPSSEIKSIFNCMGLAPRGFLRVDADGHEEFGLHPTVLSAIMNADWRLESEMRLALQTPVYPSVVPQLDINTSLHNLTDGRFSVAPLFMPVSPAVAFASRLRFMPVQRGLLQTMEELARAGIHNQSGILHAIDEVQSYCGLAARAPDLMLALETMIVQQTATLVELVHHITYAHRHAYVKDSPAWFRHAVLAQPLFNQRQLFQIPDAAYTTMGAGH